MLISFRVSNFLSFDEMQELSMIAGKTRSKTNHIRVCRENLKLLKFSALYGANASGKSNLLKAIAYAKTTIIKGLQYKANSYCRTYAKNKEKLSVFDFEILLDDKCYAYGFEVSIYQNSIKREWLSEVSKNKEVDIYCREIGKGVVFNEEYFGEEILKRLKIYAEDVDKQDDILFLTVMNMNKNSLYEGHAELMILRKIFGWFNTTLTIIEPNTKIATDSYYESEEGLQKITELTSQFDTGIIKCKTQKIDKLDMVKINKGLVEQIIENMENAYSELEKGGAKEPKINYFLRANNDLYIFEKKRIEDLEIKTVKFEHRNDEGEYLFSEESDGTIRLLDILEILLNERTDKVYLVDELDRCLHPKLTCKFIETFLNKIGIGNIQLFVTTHESRLLDLDLLRRDEVWFADRDENGPTKIYSLEEYSERFDKKIDKAYLDGRYGGVPIF